LPLRPHSPGYSRHFPRNIADPHVALLVHILNGLKDPTARAEWMTRRLPLTAGMIGLERSWTGLTDLNSDGSGAFARPRAR